MGGGSKKELQRVEYTQIFPWIWACKISYSPAWTMNGHRSPNNITIVDSLYLYLYSFFSSFSLFCWCCCNVLFCTVFWWFLDLQFCINILRERLLRVSRKKLYYLLHMPCPLLQLEKVISKIFTWWFCFRMIFVIGLNFHVKKGVVAWHWTIISKLRGNSFQVPEPSNIFTFMISS